LINAGTLNQYYIDIPMFRKFIKRFILCFFHNILRIFACYPQPHARRKLRFIDIGRFIFHFLIFFKLFLHFCLFLFFFITHFRLFVIFFNFWVNNFNNFSVFIKIHLRYMPRLFVLLFYHIYNKMVVFIGTYFLFHFIYFIIGIKFVN